MTMIKGSDVYHVVEETVPLYVAMLCGYIAVKWAKLFTPDQCAGINKFVAKFVLPLLSFKFIARSNPYEMNHKLLASDCIQKILALVALVAVARLFPRGRLSWVITGMALLTLPNTLVLGIPMLASMYGPQTETLLIQIVVLQSLVWYNLLLFLFELNAARAASSIVPSEAAAGDIEMLSQDSLRQESNGGLATGTDHEEEPNGSTSGPVIRRYPRVAIILFEVAKKLLLNPNIYAALLGLIWAFVKFRWNLELPAIIQKSIDILADGGLGMAMFSLGLFMALRGRIIACGIKLAILALVARFIIGVLLMAAPTLAFRMKGTLLRVLIIQAALPQGLVPFVFATEYNVHPDILGTGVIFGMLIALPVALVYYILLSIV